ncbi:MAG: carbohydrate ABC transporter permease [Acholeplasmatales bacterium]|jgi:ABC-type glycerol-3-phosphate transport system permease component|nr:carbohydrate ABC transporter permease [Acholeplasmatales bacterium]
MKINNKKRRKSKFQSTIINPTRFSTSQIKYYLILIPIALIMILPILYIFVTAFKPIDELTKWPPSFFVYKPTLSNFSDLFNLSDQTRIPVSRYLFNSITVSLITVILTIFISTLAGFALSKLKFKLNGVIMKINTIALMFVSASIAIPKYLIVEKLGLTNTFFVNIIPSLAMPVGLFLIKQFIDLIPDELIESARMDGASNFEVYFKVIIPLIMPAIATVAILSFQSAWNDTSASINYIDEDALKTFAYYLSTLVTAENTVAGAGMLAASTLIMFLPNLLVFIFLQSRVMDTMAHSGIK